MAASAAEQIYNYQHEQIEQIPPVLAVPELAEDALVRKRAARFIGQCLAGQEFIVQEGEEVDQLRPIESLYDAIGLAAKGDATARKMVETNARTDVVERTIKIGHVIKVELNVDEAGDIQQHGQKMESIQANSLRLASDMPQMKNRTEAEATNSFRIKQYYEQGILENYYFVVFSRAADDMTKEQMDAVGFFTDTMSCALQVTTEENGILTTESAFVSGAKKPGINRHDGSTISRIGEVLGVDLNNKSATETINTPILIPKSLMPGGVIDLVMLYDMCAGGTFFGEDRQPEDYIEYLKKCKEREVALQPKVGSIVNELVSRASKIRSKVDAVRQLHKISEKHMVEQAVFDETINPRVFGPVAADYIGQARAEFELGNNEAGLLLVNRAKDTADSKSCPSVINDQDESEFGIENDDKMKKDDKECVFISKKCPKCGEKNVKTTVTKKRITGSCGCVVNK